MSIKIKPFYMFSLRLLFVCFVLSIFVRSIYGSELPIETGNDNEIMLSAEQIGKHYNELKGYRVHTVLWIYDYKFGDPFAHAAEDQKVYSFHIPNLLTKPKPEKKQYIEVIATVDGKILGSISLKDTIVISQGKIAEEVRKRITDSEKTSIPDIAAFTSTVDEARQRFEQKENERFEKIVSNARAEFEKSDAIITLSPQQLHHYCSDLENMKFHTVLTVSSVQKDHFSAKLKEKDWLESFSCYFDWDIDLRKHVNKGDVVEIIGTITSGWLNSTRYTSCKIISTGDDAQDALESILSNEAEQQNIIDIFLGNTSSEDPNEKISSAQGTENDSRKAEITEQPTEISFSETEEMVSAGSRMDDFENMAELLTAANHPQIYDTEESAHIFYQNAPEKAVAITTWSESLTDYFDKSPDFQILWLDGNPLDLDKKDAEPTIGFVTIDFTALPEKVNIATAMQYADSFIPADIYQYNGKREKYIGAENDVPADRRVCWVAYYDTLVSDINRGSLAVSFYGDSEENVTSSFTNFNDDYTPLTVYKKTEWDIAIENEKAIEERTPGAVEEAQEEHSFIVLQRGDLNENVREIQSILISLGYLSSPADGDFGPRTEQAVKEFQQAAGIETTGIIDERTYDLLNSRQTPKKAAEPQKPKLNVNNTRVMYAIADVNVRANPSIDSSKIGFIEQGESVKAGEAENGWTPIVYTTGVGYVSSQYLSPTSPVLTLVPESNTAQTGIGTRNTYEQMVWIPTHGGQRFHSKSSCSGMINPQQVTRSEAEAMGFTPCGRCRP